MMELDWPQFLLELDRRQKTDALVRFECRGAFLQFRSRLVAVERPVAFSAETMVKFGVVPYYVALEFANGVRINLCMRHVKAVFRKGRGLIVSFKSEEGTKSNSIAFDLEESRREGRAG